MQIDKSGLKARMLALEEEELAAAKDHYESFLHEAMMAEGEPHERDEMAAARVAADLAHAFADPVHDHQAKLNALKVLDFGPRDDVGPGAVVALGPRFFVVSVSTRQFDFGDAVYMGISTGSPIYNMLAGKVEGDEVTHKGEVLTIDGVW